MALLERGLRFGEDEGDYVLWKPCHGIELWMPMDGEECVGLSPHYRTTPTSETAKVLFKVVAILEAEDGATVQGTVGDSGVTAFVPNYVKGMLTEACAFQFALFADSWFEGEGPVLRTEAEVTTLTGSVLLAEVLENTDTESPFVHLTVRSSVGDIDVVMEACTALPEVAKTICVRGWLSGSLP